MSILNLLQKDLEKYGEKMTIQETSLEFSSTDAMNLNSEIGGVVEDRERMLKQSVANASRYPITR